LSDHFDDYNGSAACNSSRLHVSIIQVSWDTMTFNIDKLATFVTGHGDRVLTSNIMSSDRYYNSTGHHGIVSKLAAKSA